MSVVGIDLGTTNTVVACVRAGKVHVLADELGQRLLPSVVSFHPNGQVLVGAGARGRRVIDPRNTVYSHKRLIGRAWGSPEIAQAKARLPFELKEGPGQGPLVHARGQDYTLPEISAFVLKRARAIAELALGGQVDRAVITVPAHFNELQRASTKVAGRVSGVEVLRILNEPTAAALAYGLGRSGSERVAVYDFGGGTFDCTLLDLNGNVFEVLATAGDSFLGGDDVDSAIAERIAEAYLKAHRYDPRTDPQMLERLKACAEEIKVVLSTADTHTVVLRDFGHGAGGSSISYTFTMTRQDLEHLATPLVDRTFKVTQDALALARLTPTSFDKVILVGGSTRMPLVRKRVEAFFGAPPLDRVNPDEVVAIGAAIQASALADSTRKRSLPAPPSITGGRPPDFGIPSASAPPPPTGAAGARAPMTSPLGSPHKITNPGVAPATLPLGHGQGPDQSLLGNTVTATAMADGAARASDPSFPSVTREPSPTTRRFGEASPGTSKMREPEPFGEHGVPGGQFGAVRDLSLVSSSGVGTAAGQPQEATGELGFGQIADLSLVSSSSATASGEGLDAAREELLARFANEGEPTAIGARARDGTVDLGPDAATAARRLAPLEQADDGADLPSIAGSADLPSLSEGPLGRGRRPEPRKVGQLGMSSGGGASMEGKPPPPAAAQPFGPMEKIGAPPSRPARPASMQPAPPPPPPMPAKVTPRGPPSRPPALPPAHASASPRGAPLRPSAPPSQPPPLRPRQTPAFQSAPPAYVPEHAAPFGDVGYSPPPFAAPHRPQPPGFAPYAPGPPDAPLDVSTMPQGYDPSTRVGPPGSVPPQGIRYAAPILVDVTPRGLVVETAGGYADTIIPRNSKIPCERTRRFATGRDMQTTVRVRVAQGESTAFAQSTYLGEVDLAGLRPAPRGEVVVAVTFEVDADGSLRVRARDVQTGQEARATLQLVGVADESSVVMMINRFAQQPVVGQETPHGSTPPHGPTY